MENRKARLKRYIDILYNIKIGDFISLKYQGNWSFYKVVRTDGVVELLDWKNPNISAGYECKDLVDLFATMISDFNIGVLEDISIKNKVK